uniref:PNPLA domain-containing protein n=1 Tax=Alexandrium monilatum TaxID=311494 RepID=A0A7S4QNG8_9DINO
MSSWPVWKYEPLEEAGAGNAVAGEASEEEDSEEEDDEGVGNSVEEDSGSEDSDSIMLEELIRSNQFERVLAEEREAVEKDRLQRHLGAPASARASGAPFSVALSGGGIRAAAFQTGVLWRLAEEGCLKDVEHISAVSGGSWAAMGFASHVVRAGQPEAGRSLDAWYLNTVAKTISRMVHNAPYLARDLGKDPFSFPDDGSSTLPRAFDIPILMGTLASSLLVRPFFHTALYLLPLTELVDIFFGAQMRELLCWPFTWAKNWDGWPIRNLCRIPVCIFLCASASALVLRAVGVCKPFRRPGSTGWLCVKASFSLLTRVAASMVGLLVIIGVTAFMETWAYSTKGVRREVCERYILNASQRLVCHDTPLMSSVPWYNKSGFLKYYRERAASNASGLVPPGWEFIHPNYTAAAAWNTALTYMYGGPTVMRSLVDSLFLAALATLSCLLLLTLVCAPLYPQNFLQVLNLAGPIMVLSIVCSAVQWRVFGPITGQRLLSFEWLPFDNASWHTIYTASLVTTMATLPFYYFLRGNAHRFYRRSLRLAFFADGRQLTWGEIRRSCYCPSILVSATVTDYVSPGEKLPINPICFSPLHFGGSSLGFVKMAPGSNVAKAMAMSGAAPDAVALARVQHLRSRFWLEVLGIGVGQHIQFDTARSRQWALLQRLFTRRGEEAPEIVYRLPSVLLFEVVYGLLLLSEGTMHQLRQCVTGRVIFYHGIALAVTMVALSFFAFLPQLDFLLHSAVIRTIHQVTGYYHRGRSPPSLLYVTDGMVEDNTGVMDLLRRRCQRILLIYAGGDVKDEFKFLRKIVEAAAAAKIASIYDLEDPRNDIGVAVDRYRQHTDKRFLQLGILYGWDGPPELRKAGRLLILKIHLPLRLQDMPAQPLLTEAEVRGEDGADMSPRAWETNLPLPGKRARDLSGCCCDCCHKCGWKCGSMFPFPPTGMQFLTPQVTSSLCRLGHCVSEGVTEVLRAPFQEARVSECQAVQAALPHRPRPCRPGGQADSLRA